MLQMSLNDEHTLAEQKRHLRRLAYAARAAQPDKDETSRSVCSELVDMPEYREAETVLWYLHNRSELRTRQAVASALAGRKRIVIPYCVGDELRLWHLQDMAELTIGSFGIPEPPETRWYEADRTVEEKQLDLVIVPGVAFDRHCGRLGSGKGYYDKLLENLRPDALMVAPCFESQIFDRVPQGRHDIRVNMIVTEQHVYRCN